MKKRILFFLLWLIALFQFLPLSTANAQYFEGGYYGQGYYQGYYQGGYYSEGGYYGQGYYQGYYQGTYYSEGSYYSQGYYQGYYQGTYYSEGSYYSQSYYQATYATPTPTPCVPSFAVSCSPSCLSWPTNCGQATNCIDNCGNHYVGQCNACPTPTPTPSCPQITCGGNPGAGGTCVYPSSPNVNIGSCNYTCPGTTRTVPGHTISVCQSNNCYANSCQCWPNDTNACNNGHALTNQICQNHTWVDNGSSCVLNCPTVSCDTGKSCQACGVNCGNGLQSCSYTTSSTGQPCTPVTFNQNCSNVCANGQQCKQNFCVAASTIAGNVFLDNNKNGLKDAGEGNYPGAISITSTGGSVTSGAGAYTVSGLSDGAYTVSYTSLPTGYALTYPQNGPPPAFTVTVGAACSTGGSNSAVCNGGNITNLNFGITNSNPWIQCIGADCRIDSGFTDNIPSGASCGAYASLPGSGGTPGLVVSGNASPTFGQGQASQNPYNWVVGGVSYPEVYGPVKTGGLVKTGYSFLQSKASQAGLNIVDIATYCTGGIGNCTLSASIPHGVYIANGNLTLVGGGFTFPSGQNYVILVNGDLTIKEKILVPNGSTATFSSSGNINIDKAVGEASPASTASDIEGIYSSDKSFIVQGTNNCSVGTDLRFNVSGGVITNAAGAGGSFQNQRDLCAGNVSCPAFSAIERLDLILNTPDFMKQANFTYQEIAP